MNANELKWLEQKKADLEALRKAVLDSELDPSEITKGIMKTQRQRCFNKYPESETEVLHTMKDAVQDAQKSKEDGSFPF